MNRITAWFRAQWEDLKQPVVSDLYTSPQVLREQRRNREIDSAIKREVYVSKIVGGQKKHGLTWDGRIKCPE